MRFVRLLAPLLLLTAAASAADIGSTFREGVLGVPWGASLDTLIGIYPDGEHSFATTPGQRSYAVRDGQTFLGIPREHASVRYGLDEQNKVAIVAVAYPFERKEELRDVLLQLFGPPLFNRTWQNGEIQYGWGARAGWIATVRILGEPRYQLVWLTIVTPSYKVESNK